ncbi:D-tagatose-1,6-bisphosphate aldolase subunit GatZ/KbaZ [Eubacterium aggregans]|uniref:D-tagatose-1,6-bisphosphate aldolase subunit GatZ/KbaZ n=1 Tax=Eubacterium aggregans TaxID=81409 RepID=A0A1H4CGL4_9FIRM|nr:class II D-tagatose-bisphosphate aldolase, non-catalytic subunit [Eubacterium aggregans]SEA59565.1 D-tagatose-1,6-bisphosphate aldolase subunit GatZ/KbaZ [Eubacterium aggregans]
MTMKNPLLTQIIEGRQRDKSIGIYSACSANPLVLEAVVERALETDSVALIEATANQVNQFGGYTGMTPRDFYDMVWNMAREKGMPGEQLILGGDHLGPLTWQDEEEAIAMDKAEALVRAFVAAGFTKIHLDTSMRLADDDPTLPLADTTIARRAARLAAACEETFKNEVLGQHPDAIEPVYIVGSEVPIPGGAQEEESIHITTPEDFENTLAHFKAAFEAVGASEAYTRIIGVVVQPGVEFGDNAVEAYDRERAAALCQSLTHHPGLVFEGHSTDYQTPRDLRRMVEDGIAILKVGPALTFACREACFALEAMEQEVVRDEEKRSQFKSTLLKTLYHTPKYWKRYYDEDQLTLKMKYSYSDRVRYVFGEAPVQQALAELMDNLNNEPVPRALISQYMPRQYDRVCAGTLEPRAEALIKDRIKDLIDHYLYATGVVSPGR